MAKIREAFKISDIIKMLWTAETDEEKEIIKEALEIKKEENSGRILNLEKMFQDSKNIGKVKVTKINGEKIQKVKTPKIKPKQIEDDEENSKKSKQNSKEEE